MAEITAACKELREKSGAGVMDQEGIGWSWRWYPELTELLREKVWLKQLRKLTVLPLKVRLVFMSPVTLQQKLK